MDYEEFSMYYKAIDILEAQEILVQMKVSDYPTMKPESRSEFHHTISKTAYPKERKILTTKELAKKLGMV